MADTLPPEMSRDDEYSAHNDRRYALLDDLCQMLKTWKLL